MFKKCWICGEQIREDIFYGEIRLVNINQPYSTNTKSKPVFICSHCMINKIGLDILGKNLNRWKKQEK